MQVTIGHASKNISEFLWLLNVFFVLVAIRSYKVYISSKTHLPMHFDLKFWIHSDSFLGAEKNASCVKWFISVSIVAEHHFFLAIIRSYKLHVLSKTCLQMHCNFKFWIRTISFLLTGHDCSSAMQNIKTLNMRKWQDAIMIRWRTLTHQIPCKTCTHAVLFH